MVDFLITGSNGLLGSSLVQFLSVNKRSFVGADLGKSANQHLGAHEFVVCDPTRSADVAALIEKAKPTVIIHGAAMTAVDLCETERERAYHSNVTATATLASLAAKNRARLIYVSTDYVFDGVNGGYTESPLSPLGVYATTKAAGELAVRSILPEHIIARTSVPFGPFEHVKKDFVRWLREELSARREVRIVTDQISNPTYAPDLARMLIHAVDSGFLGTIHTTGATSLGRFDFAMAICEAFGLDKNLVKPIKTSDLKQASPRPLNASLSVEKANARGFAPKTIQEALAILRAL